MFLKNVIEPIFGLSALSFFHLWIFDSKLSCIVFQSKGLIIFLKNQIEPMFGPFFIFHSFTKLRLQIIMNHIIKPWSQNYTCFSCTNMQSNYRVNVFREKFTRPKEQFTVAHRDKLHYEQLLLNNRLRT